MGIGKFELIGHFGLSLDADRNSGYLATCLFWSNLECGCRSADIAYAHASLFPSIAPQERVQCGHLTAADLKFAHLEGRKMMPELKGYEAGSGSTSFFEAELCVYGSHFESHKTEEVSQNCFFLIRSKRGILPE